MMLNHKFLQPLSRLSFDDANKKVMVDSSLKMINFDQIKDKYKIVFHKGVSLKSNDALFALNENELFFIEFKNGKINSDELKIKNYDSVILLSVLLDTKIIELKTKLNYILVYNEIKNTHSPIQLSKSRNKIGSYLALKSKQRFIKFKLHDAKNYLFNDVFTLTVDEFFKYFVNHWELENEPENEEYLTQMNLFLEQFGAFLPDD